LHCARAKSVLLVAEDDGGLAGHVATLPVPVSDGTPGWHGPGLISVSPVLRGPGIGSAPMHAALAGAAGCMLVGRPGSTGALFFAMNHRWCTWAPA
jgi:predicted N-acetyltransferase YhbS